MSTQYQACRIMGVREPIRWLFKVWGDGVCAKALSNALNSNVFVFRKGLDDQPPHVFSPVGQHIRPQGVRDEPLRDNSIYIEFDEKAEHYDALVIRQRRAMPIEPATGVGNDAGSADVGSRETEVAPTKRDRSSLRRMRRHICKKRKGDVDGNEEEPAAKKSRFDAGEEMDEKRTIRGREDGNDAGEPAAKKLKKMSKRSKSALRETLTVVAAGCKADAAVPSPKGVAAVPSPECVAAVPSPEGVAAGYGSSVPQIMPVCVKCKLPCSKGKATGKQKTCFTCKHCNSRVVQLYRIHGTWPPAAFKLLDDDAKTKFYQEARTLSNKVALKVLCDEVIVTKSRDSISTSEAGEYLPLTVYKRRGFNTKRIKKNCLDYREDPILGRCYKIGIKGSLDKHEESRERYEKVTISDGPPLMVAAPAAAAGSRVGAGAAPGVKLTQKEKDRLKSNATADKAHMRETIRLAKATATQQARSEKADRKECESTLRALVKASFNLKMASAGKNLNKFSPEDKAAVSALMKSLTAEAKKCENFLGGKGALLDKRG